MSPTEQVIRLAKQADVKLSASFNAPDVLPFASEALEVIAKHPHLQAEFENLFLEMPAYAPTEFIEVCMHALRWSAVKSEYERRCRAAVERNDWRTEPIYRHYLEAFEENWEDADDFYASYFRRGSPMPNPSFKRTPDGAA
ncbi:hypothetical protein [Pseudomonas sp. WAC2]|uniref:hypothetical protein n=1 Tax=Pseudomonas sp. WAC2 TaxID=3055057 RepID=UPI0025AEDDD0|nr:hypothetical protein [Pseudomonas sp. WAC2]MDN3237993.1 hypothetical protein [Pseudomonas sp. WAC2]